MALPRIPQDAEPHLSYLNRLYTSRCPPLTRALIRPTLPCNRRPRRLAVVPQATGFFFDHGHPTQHTSPALGRRRLPAGCRASPPGFCDGDIQRPYLNGEPRVPLTDRNPPSDIHTCRASSACLPIPARQSYCPNAE
jgi:hypothetical protein